MTTSPTMLDAFVDFEKMYDNRFDWEAEHTVWMKDLETLQWVLLATKKNPDDLISYAVSSSVYSESMMIMHGWAAPANDEIQPSKHPGRIRVRLMVHIDNGVITVANKMIDQYINIIENATEGRFIELVREALEFTEVHHPDKKG
jgi:hypothetical protein